ncbi:hypothetical protein [Carboxylicivirga taeanensis]|uniref:hypothetical protein n=1 Tax=Carboxylicivirga taeanensis TaxID=1416875 RepID=UPI003F6E1CEA
MSKQTLKAELVAALNQLVEQKESALLLAIDDVLESMQNDTKSSAGDKFETGREMMQIELNNKRAQLNHVLRLKRDLQQIDVHAIKNKVEFGSIVQANNGFYFLSVPLGKVVINKTTYLAVSLASPIGQALKGHQVHDTISFNKQTLTIAAIY